MAGLGAGHRAGRVRRVRGAAPGYCGGVAKLRYENKKPPAEGQGLFDTGLLVGFFLAQHNPERLAVGTTDDASLDLDSHPIDDFFSIALVHGYASKERLQHGT